MNKPYISKVQFFAYIIHIMRWWNSNWVQVSTEMGEKSFSDCYIENIQTYIYCKWVTIVIEYGYSTWRKRRGQGYTKLTCRSNLHPSSFRRKFLVISNMAHMATSAALPCFTHQKKPQFSISDATEYTQLSGTWTQEAAKLILRSFFPLTWAVIVHINSSRVGMTQ